MRSLRFALIGRTGMLLDAGKQLVSQGHKVAMVATASPSGHEAVGIQEYQRWAEDVAAPFFVGRALESPECMNLVRSSEVDFGISMNWPRLISREVISFFRAGIFNAHPGDLPRYKGNACPNWAILMNETEVTLSVHAMTEGLDAGPIARKIRLPLSDTVDVEAVYSWLAKAVPDGFSEVAAALSAGELKLDPQPADPSEGLRCYPRRPEDGHIEWSKDITQIHRLIRASGRPFDGAYSFLLGKQRVTIWKAQRVPITEPFLAVPGQVAFGDDGDPVIACEGGYLRLTEIDVEGVDRPQAKSYILASLRNRLSAQRRELA